MCFRFRRELHYQLPPIREISYDYQLNLMSFVKIHPRHTSVIQCPVLGPRILHRHTYSVSRHNVSTPVFHPTAVEHSQTYCLQASTLLFFFFWKKVWVVLWQNEWSPKNIRSKLSPSSTLSYPLENKRPNLPSAQLPPAWITGSDKVSEDFSVGISQRTSEFTPSQSFHSPAGAKLARLNMTFPKWWAPNLVSVPP